MSIDNVLSIVSWLYLFSRDLFETFTSSTRVCLFALLVLRHLPVKVGSSWTCFFEGTFQNLARFGVHDQLAIA